jgi:hypothetical protein
LRSYHYSSHHSFSQNLHPHLRYQTKKNGYFGERRIISTKNIELKQQRLNQKAVIRHISLLQTKPENITREKKPTNFFSIKHSPTPSPNIITNTRMRCAHYKLNITFCASKATRTESFKQKKIFRCLQVSPSLAKQKLYTIVSKMLSRVQIHSRLHFLSKRLPNSTLIK